MSKVIPLIVVLVMGCVSVKHSDSLINNGKNFYAQKTESFIFIDDNNEKLPYRLFLPENYSSEIEYPLLLSFHGAGEKGDDNFQQLEPWVAAWINDNIQAKNPCIILMPQCPQNRQWVDVPFQKGSYSISEVPMTKPMKLVKKIFDKIMNEYSVDENRVYVMGVSMGGYATWNFILNYPDIPAAAVPICGAGDPSLANRIKSLPIWAFHGDRDEVVPISGTTDMTNQLKKLGNNNVRVTIYENVGHESYDMAWKDLDLIRWVFKQNKLIR